MTPPWLNFKVLSKSTPTLQPGTLIDYSLKVHGVPVRWRTRIEEWKENEYFVDTQLKGPYALWHHTHLFENVQGGTLMTDIVRYRLPLGAPGQMAGHTFVEKDIEQIFGYRKKVVEEIFP